ncbi:hypothetical protein [Hymenobacter tenuis]
MLKPFLISFLLLWGWSAQAQSAAAKEPCDCPPPTARQFSDVCVDLYRGAAASNQEWEDVRFGWEEDLWKMSCATPGVDTPEQAKTKIKCMWNKYRESFRCYDYTGTVASEKNITKMATDIGRREFVQIALRTYQLDMNFVDPADKKTLLDFVVERKATLGKQMPLNEHEIESYEKLRLLLVKHGAKQAKELRR